MPKGIFRRTPVEDRVSRKVEFTDSCWLWHGKLTNHGYGMMQIGYKCHLAHRISYELFNGPFDKKLGVLHRCDVRNCINPKHLFLGTQKDNNLDAARKNRMPYGEKHWNCKIRTSDITEIFKLSKYVLQKNIAEKFGVSTSAINAILRGRGRKKELQNVA